jgi:hypothetical protein
VTWIATTQESGATFGSIGEWFRLRPTANLYGTLTAADIVEIALPSGVNTFNALPSFATFNDAAKSRLYAVGGWTDNLLLTEDFRLYRLGIQAPTNELVAVSGTGSAVGVTLSGTGITAEIVPYIRWWDDVHQRRSPLSGPGPVISAADDSVTYDNLPTTAPESVTHIEFWEARDGASPRFVARRDLGTTSFTHAVPTLSLGEAETSSFGRFPRCRINVMWHDRHVLAGDDRYPNRIYFSDLNEPERYAGFFLRTRKGERVVALISTRDHLIVCGAHSMYIVTGWTEDDIAMEILEPRIGCINHQAVAQPHGNTIIPSHQGPYLLVGTSVHPINREFKKLWRQQLDAHRLDYDEAFAVDDTGENVYLLYVGQNSYVTDPRETPVTVRTQWVLDYTPTLVEEGGGYGQPNLAFDAQVRQYTAAAMLDVPGGRGGHLFVGANDGHIRWANVHTDADAAFDDDGDAFDKTWIVRTGHYEHNEEGGDHTDGWRYPTLWTFMQSEEAPYDVNLYLGDEQARQALAPTYSETVDAGELTVAVPGPSSDQELLVPKTEHYMTPNVAGGGLTLEIVQENPRSQDSYFAGFGGTRVPGEKQRYAKQLITDPG